MFTADFSGTSLDHTITLGKGQWEGSFSPSPILLEQAEKFSLASRFSSGQIDCWGLAGSILFLDFLFKSLFGPFVEMSVGILLNGAPIFGGFFLFLGIFAQ